MVIVRETLIRALSREGLDLDAVMRVVLAVGGFDAPIDIEQFQPIEHAGYTIEAVKLAHHYGELHELHRDHWQQTEKYRHGLALDVDYEAMRELERHGRLLQIVARREGAIVGHVRMYLGKSMHTSLLHATEDTLYLQPEHRGGFVAIRMMRYAERCLLALGVRSIEANSKLISQREGGPGADVLMRRLGYQPCAIQFSKVFPGAPDVQ